MNLLRYLGPRLCGVTVFVLGSELAVPTHMAAQAPRSPEYAAVQERLAHGWNTWDVYSAGAQALLPEGFTLRVGLKHNSTLYADAFLSDVQIGLRGKGEVDVVPGPHTWNGDYTEMRFTWRGHDVLLQTAHDGDDLVMLATPGASKDGLPPTLVVSAGILWNRPGSAAKLGDHIEFSGGSRKIPVYWTGGEHAPDTVPLATPFFAAPFRDAIGVSTGRPRSVEEIRAVLSHRRPLGDAVPRAGAELLHRGDQELLDRPLGADLAGGRASVSEIRTDAQGEGVSHSSRTWRCCRYDRAADWSAAERCDGLGTGE